LAGWGGDALLRSYGEERRPIFQETAKDFIAGRIAVDRAFLERYSPERDRAEFERAWKERAAGLGERVLSYEPNYEGSAVVSGPPGGESGAHGAHSFAARPGHHLAPQPLSSGRNVFEELGPGFTLLAFDAEDLSAPAFDKAARSLGIPPKIVRDTYSGGREAYGARLTLVRPDQYVVWTGDRAPGDIARLLGKVAGRG
jgi:4-hydroxyisophthalate hydroxylase